MQTKTAPNNYPKQQKTDWEQVRAQFNLGKEYIHLAASQFLASHPKPVREAIDRYRQALDQDPELYTQEQENDLMQQAREAAARYFGHPEPDNIAMTDSTTMGLGTIYAGLGLSKGQEILTTEHDHYSHHESIRGATYRTGATYRRVPMYENLSEVTPEEMVEAIMNAIQDQTRLVGITWVHSSTGLKTPVAQIAQAIARLNQSRDEDHKVLLLVDGVHGFGIERETFQELGCDFFVSGCHKWTYGPRGTGLVAATTQAWQHVTPVIPSFTEVMDVVIAEEERPSQMDGKQMTPGGFHSLEHRWALTQAFQFLESIGKEQVWERVHYLNRLCKEGLAAMPHVTLHTPLSDELSAGIIAFEVEGYSTQDTVKHLLHHKITCTAAPYRTSYARFTPGIYNTPAEIEKALEVVYAMK
ncbi:aminotransferase class V-fold PLP-dependent enzyme [Rufibacter psychrotolerans]|uniref:aminotransferase class V-fold PLP-dependent enzyme n=1 Tax=Rufibacter psychrotolerans TaxID=2812556 RepID=UPI0019671EC5|nr:aminotransferase class V-fold PLP-dependent enzyme [Rufibacter sp. SYSU D00308]